MKFEETNAKYFHFIGDKYTAIYFLMQDDEVVYVGQTTVGSNRIMCHNDKKFNGVNIIFCDKSNLNQEESNYIIKYAPIYNKALNYNNTLTSLTKISRGNNINFDKLKNLLTIEFMELNNINCIKFGDKMLFDENNANKIIKLYKELEINSCWKRKQPVFYRIKRGE